MTAERRLTTGDTAIACPLRIDHLGHDEYVKESNACRISDGQCLGATAVRWDGYAYCSPHTPIQPHPMAGRGEVVRP